MAICKITVLKVTFQEDIAKAFSREGFGPCPLFTEGQEFVINDPWQMPANFCSTAWGDIFKNVQTICLGGNFPSAQRDGLNISCCVDGVRPVIFKIERLEERPTSPDLPCNSVPASQSVEQEQE